MNSGDSGDVELQNSTAPVTTNLEDINYNEGDVVVEDKPIQEFPKIWYNGMMLVMVIISVVVMAANAPEVEVIMIAQVKV